MWLIRLTDAAQLEKVSAAFGGLAGEGSVNVLIWTTTPWTIPSSQAISMGADLEYCLVQCATESGPDAFNLAPRHYSNL